MVKHHIGDFPKPNSDLFQANNNYHSYAVLVNHNLYKFLLVTAKQFIKHSLTLDRWLGIIYLVKFQPMCPICVLKTMPNYIYSRIICHNLD